VDQDNKIVPILLNMLATVNTEIREENTTRETYKQEKEKQLRISFKEKNR
jgi:hypothetical protein